MVPHPVSSPRLEKTEKPGPPSDFAVSAAEPRVATTSDSTTRDSTTTGAVRSAADASTPAPATSASDKLVPSALSPSEGIDAEGLRSYRVALAHEIRPYKRHPQSTIDAGWRGTVEVRVTVRAGGIAQEARLAKSSGHAELDDAALEMLRHALPATPVPAVLREREFSVSLPVVFELPE